MNKETNSINADNKKTSINNEEKEDKNLKIKSKNRNKKRNTKENIYKNI